MADSEHIPGRSYGLNTALDNRAGVPNTPNLGEKLNNDNSKEYSTTKGCGRSPNATRTQFIVDPNCLNIAKEKSKSSSNSGGGSFVIEVPEQSIYDSFSENAKRVFDELITGMPTASEYWRYIAVEKKVDVQAGLMEIERTGDYIDKSNPNWLQLKRRKL